MISSNFLHLIFQNLVAQLDNVSLSYKKIYSVFKSEFTLSIYLSPFGRTSKAEPDVKMKVEVFFVFSAAATDFSGCLLNLGSISLFEIYQHTVVLIIPNHEIELHVINYYI